MSAAPKLHPTAVIDEDAQLGPNCAIWHFCHISRHAKLGAGCTLGQNVYVAEGVSIGDRVKIQNNVSVYSGVEIADDAFVGPSVVFTNVINPRATIDRKSEFRTTRVGRGATIGANATIICGHTLGEGCFVGAGSVVTHDVSPYSLVVGNPARHVGWVDEEGNRVDRPPPSNHPLAKVRLAAPAQENAPFLDELKSISAGVLESGQFIMGAPVDSFENDVSKFLKTENAISCSSGTDALLLALLALEIGPGDEVITSPFSFFSTVECILRVGATPVFVDLAPGSFHFDFSGLSNAVTTRTRAVIPVHLFGEAFDLTEVQTLAEEHGFAIVEDAAQAFGSQTRGIAVGSGMSLTCFSFFPSKNLGGFGDGGMITTDNAELATRLRSLRSHGSVEKYHHEMLGGNFRLDALQAALLRKKLQHLPSLLQRRRANAVLYNQLFADAQLPHTRLQFPVAPQEGHTFNQFVVQTDRRDALSQALKALEIETAIYYPRPLHRQPALGKHQRPEGSFPCAETACRSVLALPCHPALTQGDVERVAQAVVACLVQNSS